MFAIVVTLLVLELNVPHLPEVYTTGYVLNELYHLLPKFIGFVISFFLIAIYWVNHHQFFHSLERSDLTATLSALISVYVAIIIFILLPVLYFIPQKIVYRR